MGNNNSTPSALPPTTHLSTYTSTHSSSLSTEAHHSFSVSPFEHSTLVSITKASSTSSSHVSSSIRTTEYCTWDWELETTSCTLRTITAPTPTPFTLPTPTGQYGTSEASFSFHHYTCTDLLCIDSVASQYGFSLCAATTFTNFGPPAETSTWPKSSTTHKLLTTAPTCDPELDWDCPGPTVMPTLTLTLHHSTETSSDYDETRSPTISSTSTEDCEYGVGCFTPLHHTSTESHHATTTTTTSSTKHSYSYHSTSTKRTTTSTTSECDFLWDDCTPALPTEPTTWEWDPDPWSGHTVSTTISPVPRESVDAEN
ncbi:hypothetical protein F5Y01DRAFT_315835 [Xylaria sp. FL0043]|nr:hypothetical protein F5Y01DRAFT_315835 [Xylaria sp. FL0043]